jgi:hypothetical protein
VKRLAVIAAIALSVVSGASAKAPPDGFRVCGVASCVALNGIDAEILAISMFYGGGTELAGGPSVAPFYALHWTSTRDGREQTSYYVSSANAVRVNESLRTPTVAPGWFALNPDAQTRLARITTGLEPFAAATPIRAVVGRKSVRDPASYAVLWTLGKRAHDWPRAGWLSVRIFTDVPSPWQGSLLFARRGNLLLRDGYVYAISARLAARIRAHASLR